MPLSELVSFRVGGPAAFVLQPKEEGSLGRALDLCRAAQIPVILLGNGTNVLPSDEGFSGLILQLSGDGTAPLFEGEKVTVGAGCSLTALAKESVQRGLMGLERLCGIPGTVGGAVAMNAGAYGGEIKNVLQKVRCIDPATLETKEYEASSLDISYRSTPFMKNKEIITGAVFSLSAGDPAEIRGKMNELMGRRKASQPLEYPSAGSTFKRPPNGYAAAMIDQSGLKGYRVGGAMVSEKHAGFVINRRNATFRNVMDVIEGVRNTVEQKFGTRLELEVEILGEE